MKMETEAGEREVEVDINCPTGAVSLENPARYRFWKVTAGT
jgi:hypothetical protein